MSLGFSFEPPLVYLSWLTRHAFAAGFVLLSGRALWLGVEAATPDPGPPRTTSSIIKGLPEPGSVSSSKDDPASSRPSLEDLQKLAGAYTPAQSGDQKKDGFSVRTILIDFGPPRSEVFIQGRRVGKTPYAAQVSCRLGDTFRVDVVPPRGAAPIHKDMRCISSEPTEITHKPKNGAP